MRLDGKPQISLINFSVLISPFTLTLKLLLLKADDVGGISRAELPLEASFWCLPLFEIEDF